MFAAPHFPTENHSRPRTVFVRNVSRNSKNMNRKEDKIKLYESLFILYKCQNAMNIIWEKLNQDCKTIKGFNYSDSPLLYHIILEVASFQEEYKNFNGRNLDAYADRINDIRAINKSIIKKINQWDLQSFRNNIVAHPWRKNGQFVIPDSLEYNIPRNAFEFQLLINYVGYSWKMIESEFDKEFKAAIDYMLTLEIKPKPKAEYNTINDEQLKLVDEVNTKCKDLGKEYFLKVFLYDFDK